MARNAVKSSEQDFSKSVNANIPRSTFYRPSGLKTTFDSGKLVPIYIDEVLPGDTFKMRMQHVARLITPIVPTMDNITLEFFAFFVPNRIVWENWEKLNGENKDTAWTPATAPAGVPQYQSGTSNLVTEGKLGDYYGLPVGMDTQYHAFNELPFRGYALIWNEWFRNQNLQAPKVIDLGNSIMISSRDYYFNKDLLAVNKPHDYFTSCLPEPQRGESQLIPISLNELIPVITSIADSGATYNGAGLRFKDTADANPAQNLVLQIDSTFGQLNGNSTTYGAPTEGAMYPSNLNADPTGIDFSATTIAELRTAFQIQKLYERDARGGTRYVEMLKAHFGVDAGDYRLQRPEYLGHSKTLIGINQVAQTSETNTTAQGNVAAYGHSQGNDFLFNKSFVEHGFVHIFAVARQKKTYQQGLERFWSRQDRLDYFLPVLGQISEQPVYTKEIYALANNPETIFGYNEAWSDYRYKPSKVTGQMRSSNSNTFEIWHYADDYSSAPTLGATWMYDNSHDNVERTLAVQTVDQIKMDVRFDLEATRPIPVNSIPGMIDHF